MASLSCEGDKTYDYRVGFNPHLDIANAAVSLVHMKQQHDEEQAHQQAVAQQSKSPSEEKVLPSREDLCLPDHNEGADETNVCFPMQEVWAWTPWLRKQYSRYFPDLPQLLDSVSKLHERQQTFEHQLTSILQAVRANSINDGINRREFLFAQRDLLEEQLAVQGALIARFQRL